MLTLTYNDELGCIISINNKRIDGIPLQLTIGTIQIRETYNPAKFETLVRTLIQADITFETLLLTNNLFVGNGFCDPLIQLIKTKQIRQVIFSETQPVLTDADRFKLAQTRFEHEMEMHFPDGYEVKHPLKMHHQQKLPRPKHGYVPRTKIPSHYSVPRRRLIQFLSLQEQQRRDYTCAPAGILMIQNFYHSLHHGMHHSKHAKVSVDDIYLRQRTEQSLSKLFGTSEKAGTDLLTMGFSLQETGYPIAVGFAGQNSTPSSNNVKRLLLYEFETLINAGIPILVNIRARDRTGAVLGHYCVVSDITDNKEVVIADPGAIYFGHGKLEQKIIARTAFLKSWVNGDGMPGGFLILFPNKSIQHVLMQELANIRKHNQA